MFELLAILCELYDLQGSQVVNEVRYLTVCQLISASELKEDFLQMSYVELVLLAIDLLQLQVDASRCVHIRKLGWLGEPTIGLVEVPTCP